MTLSLFSRGWAPYEMMDGKHPSGIGLDIFNAVMSEQFKAEVELFNKPRLNLYTQRGPVYTRLEAKEWLRKEYDYWFSAPVMPLSDIIISPASNPFEFTTPSSLEGQTVGCIRNYFYPKAAPLFKTKKATRYDVNKDIVILRMVKAGRVDVGILDYRTALWLIRNTEDLKLEDFHIATTPLDSVDLRFVFNKVESWEQHLPAINARIKEIQQNGALEKILSKYK